MGKQLAKPEKETIRKDVENYSQLNYTQRSIENGKKYAACRCKPEVKR